ncbi:MAG: ATP-binding protein [Dehalococcoidales bacterium]|nr:ATP-binding protein [Dehalococcoidales bacterium]
MKTPKVITNARWLTNNFIELPEAEAEPTIIVVSGLPGTGKSYFCRRLAERLPFLILESDALRKRLFPEPKYTAEESASLFRAIYQLIVDLLKKGIPVILDATNLEERYRERIYNIAENVDAKLIMVSVKAPPELVQKRLKKRLENKNIHDNSDADWAVYQKMKPRVERIRRKHFSVGTSQDITPVIDKVVREVKR